MLVILKEKMIDPVTLAVINGRLEQISGWLSQEPGQQVSHEWIYQYVYADKRRGGDLIPTCVARSSAGNATGVMTAGGKSGAKSRSTSGRGR
jgi:IS30 family transposase